MGREKQMNDILKGLNDKQYTVIGGIKFINLLENDGKHLVVIGNHKSEWSKYYVEELDKVIEVSDIKNVYHYKYFFLSVLKFLHIVCIIPLFSCTGKY